MYRSTGDIFDSFPSFRDILLKQENNFSMSAPGCYNDIDMLIVGMYGQGNVGIKKGCTDEEYRLHFALWAMYGGPLMIGSDLRKTNDFSKELMLNKELLRINQDEECRPPVILNFVSEDQPNEQKTIRKLFKILSGNEYVLMIVNFSDNERNITSYFTEMGIPYSSDMGLDLVDVFTGEKMGVVRDFITTTVKARSCVMLKGKLVHV